MLNNNDFRQVFREYTLLTKQRRPARAAAVYEKALGSLKVADTSCHQYGSGSHLCDEIDERTVKV